MCSTEPIEKRASPWSKWAIMAFCLSLGVACYFSALRPSNSPTVPQSSAASPSAPKAMKAGTQPPQPQDKVAAEVNGEPIYWSVVDAGLIEDAFGTDLKRMRRGKLDRLIASRTIAQFLKARKVEVPEAEIDKEIARLRETPPASGGCSCCRYGSLDDFMMANGFDMKELRGEAANQIGIQRYLSALWDQEHPEGEKRSALVRSERPRLEREYVKCSHVFINTFQNPDFENDPEGVRREARARATAACERIRKGEAFEAVAREVSDDAASKPNGGLLGCIQRNLFGKEFAQAVEALKSGEIGKPVESPYGFHVIRRDLLSDADLLDILKDDFIGKRWAETKKRIEAEAEVVRRD